MPFMIFMVSVASFGGQAHFRFATRCPYVQGRGAASLLWNTQPGGYGWVTPAKIIRSANVKSPIDTEGRNGVKPPLTLR